MSVARLGGAAFVVPVSALCLLPDPSPPPPFDTASCAAAGGAADSRDAALSVAVTAAVRAALAERTLFDRMNPFARSHHSDSISIFSAAGAERFPGSDRERQKFKKEVINFYGLSSIFGVVDMLGNLALLRAVTLAHIWPASYTNWEDPSRELALPGDFHKNP